MDGIENLSEPIEELTLDKLALHPAIAAFLEKLRSNALNLLRTSQPTDAPTIARAQAQCNVVDILLGSDQSPSLAQKLVGEAREKKREREAGTLKVRNMARHLNRHPQVLK